MGQVVIWGQSEHLGFKGVFREQIATRIVQSMGTFLIPSHATIRSPCILLGVAQATTTNLPFVQLLAFIGHSLRQVTTAISLFS